MKAFQNINSQEYFKRYGYKYGILRGLFTRWPLHIVSDYENKKILYYRQVQKWLKKKYLAYSQKDPEGLEFGTITSKNPIWIYWKQGIENAPEIVQVCLNSIKRYSKSDVFLITDKNLDEYVHFPDYIQKKIIKNEISAAAFSDLLRFTLLEHFGGTWIDSTVLLTDEIPFYYTQCDLFMLRDSTGPIYNAASLSVWFLHSQPGNEIIRETRNITYEYWKTHNTVIEYLLPYVIITMVSENHSEYVSMMPYANNEYALLLLNRLNAEYDKQQAEYLKYLSWIHKLSYKLSEEVFKNPHNFYHHIIQEGIL